MYNSNPEPMTTVTIRIPTWLKDDVIKKAADVHRSMSEVVRLALEEYCHNNGGNK